MYNIIEKLDYCITFNMYMLKLFTVIFLLYGTRMSFITRSCARPTMTGAYKRSNSTKVFSFPKITKRKKSIIKCFVPIEEVGSRYIYKYARICSPQCH